MAPLLKIWWPRTIRKKQLWALTQQKPIDKQIMKI